MKKTFFLLSEGFLKYPIIFILGLSFYLFFVTLFNKGLADYDLWGYLSFGRVFWEEGFPYHDVFAYTPTKQLWVYHEWLTGVVFWWLIKYFGPASLQLLRYILAILTIYLVYETALRRSGNHFFVVVTLIPSILLISFGYVPVRAQIFTFFFFILTLYILECSKRTGNGTILRWFPFIQIIWCNFHGGFISGLGLIFLYALGEGLARKKIAVSYLKWGIIASVATLINPYGIKYWIYIIHAVSMSRPEVTEWYSVAAALKSNLYFFPVSLFLIMSVIIVLVFLLRRKKDITELLVIIVLIYGGSVHVRHGVIFGLVLGAYAPVFLSEFAQEWKAKRHSLFLLGRFFLVIFSVFLIITYFYFYPVKQISFIPSFKFFVSADYYPTGAIKWMKNNNIKGNILPNFEWGEYITWLLYPDCRVAMDGRYETVYEDNLHKEYFDFLYGRKNWSFFLKKYPHHIVLLKAGTKTHLLMNREKDWNLVYSDKRSVVFVRKNMTNDL
ncbi:MAG: hypothetical protein JW976_04515 [Syntrophaceae bacterium]|nr:hypothetical protein [Syntrophaceae bacterium]